MNGTNSCALWPTEPTRCHTITRVLQVFSSLSLVGCTFVITIICLFKLHKYFVQRLIFFLCVCAGIDSLNSLIDASLQTSSSEIGCQVHALVTQFFNFAEILWVCSISLNMVMAINRVQISRRENLIHTLVWSISCIMTVIPLAYQQYGRAGAMCWVRRDAVKMQFAVWYVPVLLLILSLLVAYTYVIVKIYKSVDLTEGSDFEIRKKYDMMLGEVKPLIAYPIIYFFFHLPMLVGRMDDSLRPGEPPHYGLSLAGVVCAPSLGLLNALAFAAYGKTLRLLTWAHIRGAVVSFRHGSGVRVTHNYAVLDEPEDGGGLLEEEEEVEEFNISNL